ncbi:hypothetical protein C357_00919 [Citreicella sp. 357]|nr:hypothetical protein C357_00919 [Citreicella sp. 357]
MGDRYLRQLIVVGMTSRVRQVTNHPERADQPSDLARLRAVRRRLARPGL